MPFARERSFAVFFTSFMVLGERAAREKGVDVEAVRLTFKRQAAAVVGIAGAYVVFAVMTWFCCLRRSWATDRVPSLAYASI